MGWKWQKPNQFAARSLKISPLASPCCHVSYVMNWFCSLCLSAFFCLFGFFGSSSINVQRFKAPSFHIQLFDQWIRASYLLLLPSSSALGLDQETLRCKALALYRLVVWIFGSCPLVNKSFTGILKLTWMLADSPVFTVFHWNNFSPYLTSNIITALEAHFCIHRPLSCAFFCECLAHQGRLPQ